MFHSKWRYTLYKRAARMSRSTFIHKAVLGAAFLGLSLLAQASEAATLPAQQGAAVSPGRVQEQIQTPEFMRQSTTPLEVRPGKVENAPPGSENIKFVLRGIELTGVTAYQQAQLEPVYASEVGHTISLADLYGIANRLTQKFRNDGYILTQVVVPPQSIEKSGSVVKLRVIEGFVDTVSVKLEDGARAESASSMRLINDLADRIHTGQAVNIRDLERNLLLINDLPGLTARGVLSPSTAHPGGADLTILVTRKLYDAVIGVDNYGTRYLGPVQYSAAAALNSVLGHNERINLQAVAAPLMNGGPEMAYIAGGYTQPLMANGLRLDLGYSYTNTDPGYRLRQFNVNGQSNYFSADLFYPVIRSRATNLYTTGTFDLRDVKTTNNIDVDRIDHIRALRGDARLEHLDTLFGAGLNVVDVQVSQGINVFGASSKSNPNKSRALGDPTFTKFNLELQRLQRLTGQVNLLLGAKGQLSDAALLTAEQFGVGGMGFGRGYDPSEIVGDSGYSTKAELQWNVPGAFGFVHDNQLFSFWDFGQVWTRNTIAQFRTESEASVGFGIRSKLFKATSADFTFAQPLTRRVATEDDTDPRYFFSITQKF
jgi:hemolysin activation/secretion protein